MYKTLELRLLGTAIGDNLQICFNNCLSVSIHYEEIRNEASNLGGIVASESLILFTSSVNLMKLVAFIATL